MYALSAVATASSGVAYGVHASATSMSGPAFAGYFEGRVVVSDSLGIGTETPLAPLIPSGGNSNLDITEGDLRIGDAEDRLIIGVATGGAGAGIVDIRAKGATIPSTEVGTADETPFIINNEMVGIGTSQPARILHVDDLMKTGTSGRLPHGSCHGDLCVVGASGSRHIYCYLNGGWSQLD